MFEKDDKRRLYWLMEKYLSGKIDARTFCDEFYYSYSLEINDDDLSELEKKAFLELDTVSSRFSEYEEDHKLDSKAFFTKQQLYQKVKEVNKRLDKNI